jgi:hypothetical protein
VVGGVERFRNLHKSSAFRHASWLASAIDQIARLSGSSPSTWSICPVAGTEAWRIATGRLTPQLTRWDTVTWQRQI